MDYFEVLENYMSKIPGIKPGGMGKGQFDDGLYMNGGPELFLSWVIESKHKDFSPSELAEWLEGRLPRPVDDLQE